MAELQIIGFARSTYVRVVRIVAEEKGVPYTLVDTPFGSETAAAHHPTAKIPALVHGDFRLFESRAIATYLDRAFEGPSLTPADPKEAALVEQWVSFVNTSADPCLVRRYLITYLTAKGQPDPAVIASFQPEMAKHFKILDDALADGPHLVGDTFTLADANLIPILFYMQKFPESLALYDASPNVKAFYAAHAGRPSVTATEPALG